MGAAIGLTPKSSFLDWMRSSTLRSGPVDEGVRKKELQDIRGQLFHRFGNRMSAAHSSRHAGGNCHTPPRVTRSSAAVADDDWVVDTDAATCEVTDVRRLDRYPLEHLFTLSEKTRLLLLVTVDNDDRVFGGIGMKVDAMQCNEQISLAGREYYRIKCAISDATFNNLVTGGVARKMYSQEKFASDLDNGQGGFQVAFLGTQKTAHFTWKRSFPIL